MNNELLSVIVPLYNAEKTIERCINSLLNQTYKNIEIILIDDGSYDKSYSICKKYQNKDDRIVLLHQINSGVSKARNLGLSVARGIYIGFVDSDDYIENNTYCMIINKMKKTNSKIGICNYFFETEDGKEILNYNNPDLFFSRESFPNKMFENLSINGYLCNKVYHRSLIFKNKLSICLNENIAMLEDNLYNYEIFDTNESFNCIYLNNKFYHYVQYNNSACNKKYDYTKLQYFIVRDMQIKILEKNNIDADFLKADYVINFVKSKIKLSILNIERNDLYYHVMKKANNYKKQISINKLSKKNRIKYLLSKWFPFVYYIYIRMKKENI